MRHLVSGLAALVVASGSWGAAHSATLFMGAYPNSLLVVSEANGSILQRIPLESGLPVSMRLSNDKKLIYVVTNTRSGIEVIDVATRKSINSFSLNTPNKRYRFSGGAPDPTGRYFYTVLTEITKLNDRYEVSKPKYAAIDLQEKKIARMVDVDAADENANRTGGRNVFVVSDDGKQLYQFRDKVIVIDSTDFKVIERLDLALPEATPGMESISYGGTIDALAEPGHHVSLFTAQDPYINNRVFGVARFNLASRGVDFDPIGPSPAAMSGFQVTPDGKTAYTVVSHGTLMNRRCEFWRFDLATNAMQQRSEFDCKSRFTLGMSGDGSKLYIYGATFDLEVYDAQTMKYEQTWDLQNDITGAGMIITQ
jgi:hypothetical protein